MAIIKTIDSVIVITISRENKLFISIANELRELNKNEVYELITKLQELHNLMS